MSHWKSDLFFTISASVDEIFSILFFNTFYFKQEGHGISYEGHAV